MECKPLAFVIMPFEDQFTTVFSHFIKPILEELGFSVERADDIENQRNILRDIVENIHNSALIIADLTTANANVFYELGLAHALRKPVILMTQSIEEVPFDLGPYRLLEYSTHFVEIEEAKEKLTSYVKGFRERTTKFGSPITDFSPDAITPKQQVETEQHPTNGKEEPGYFDHIVAILEGYSRITEIIEGVTQDLSGLTRSLEDSTGKFNDINIHPSETSATAARGVARQLAKRLATFNSQLTKGNSEYKVVAQDTEDSLEFVVSFHEEQSEAANPELSEVVNSLRNLRGEAIIGRDTFLALAENMESLPRLERRLNREVTRGSEEIRVMANNIDRTVSSISRALSKYD